ncbi:hypothetical protein KCU69_g112, partial [Aureobasidium melanogenum]
MCFGKRDSVSASSFSSSSSDEPHARPIELATISRSPGTNRATANMPQQAPQRAASRETIRFVEEVNITCDDQHKAGSLFHLRAEIQTSKSSILLEKGKVPL